MKRFFGAPLALALLLSGASAQASWISPFISEIHYDNSGADVGEFVAVTAPGDIDLAGWQLVLYNGADGRPYASTGISDMLGGSGSGSGWVEYYWAVAGIQNGPDAVALVAPSDTLVELIAYEAEASEFSHIAAENVGRRLPLSENGATLMNTSLQRIGGAADWDWIAAAATPGMLNPGLSGLSSLTEGRVPAAHVGWLWLTGLAGWLLVCSRRRARIGVGVVRCRPHCRI